MSVFWMPSQAVASPNRPGGPVLLPAVFPPDAKPPFRLGDLLVEGGTLAYLIRLGGRQVLVFGSPLGNPRLVLPTHWDRFNVPYDFSQQLAIERLQSLVAEVKAASPGTKVVGPEYFRPIQIDR